MILKGSLCKEDLLDIINNVDWGEPKRNGKHYRNFDGLISKQSDGDEFDVKLHWRQLKADWGKEPDVFLKFYTKEAFDNVMAQKKYHSNKMKHLNNNNNKSNDIIYG